VRAAAHLLAGAGPSDLGPGLEVQVGLIAVVLGVGAVGLLVAFAYLYRRHRVFTRGLRGTGVVVEVRPTAVLERYSVVERPTERVVVATAAVPRGVLTDQKLPAGQYAPGQVVPVVQDPGDPHRLYVDRPDLERPASIVYAPLVVVLLMPVVATLGIGRLLAGG